MKKLSIFGLLMALTLMVAFSAFAFSTGGEFAGDRLGNAPTRYSTDLAPVSQQVVKVTKGFYNLPLSNYTQYKFWFTKTVDDTAATAICKILVGGYTTGSETGIVTAGERLVVGKGQKFTGFKCASTAGTNINYLLQ